MNGQLSDLKELKLYYHANETLPLPFSLKDAGGNAIANGPLIIEAEATATATAIITLIMWITYC